MYFSKQPTPELRLGVGHTALVIQGGKQLGPSKAITAVIIQGNKQLYSSKEVNSCDHPGQ